MRGVLLCLFGLWPTLSVAALAVDKVVVNKSSYSLILMNEGKEVKRYWIALGPVPTGHKEREGDKRTPEGLYTLDYKKPDSAFYKAIHINYPNEDDIQRAKALGVKPGGFIMIHGQRNGKNPTLQSSNWTDGCIAMLNHEMDELWELIKPGTPILITP